jgi:hypothetical protein
LCCAAEIIESKMLNGEPWDIAEQCHISSTLVRIAARIGLRRRLKEVPSATFFLNISLPSTS